MGLPWWLSGLEFGCQCSICGFDPWVEKIPFEEGMAAHSSVLALESPMDRGAWWATVCGIAKSQTRLND